MHRSVTSRGRTYWAPKSLATVKLSEPFWKLSLNPMEHFLCSLFTRPHLVYFSVCRGAGIGGSLLNGKNDSTCVEKNKTPKQAVWGGKSQIVFVCLFV